MTEKTKKRARYIEAKYLYRYMCAVILTVTATGLFYMCWYNFVKVNNQTGHLTGKGNLLMAILCYAVLFIVIGRGLRAFVIGVDRKANLLASQVLTVWSVNTLEIFLSCAITGQLLFWADFLKRYFVLSVVQSVVLCVFVIPLINYYRRLFPPLQMIEIYGEYQNKIYEKINFRKDKYHVVKFIHCDEPEEVIRAEIEKYDAVLINDLPSVVKNKILKMCFDMDKRVYFTPKLSDVIIKSSDEINLFDTPLFLCRNQGVGIIRRFIKRLFDVVLSGLALVVLSPVMLITAIAIKMYDGGPVFFKQERCTVGGRHFIILKFRSMIVEAEEDGKPHPAGEHDDRITPVGRIIRACRIDELPQLINILKNDMSIVGPRPERVEHVEKYTADIPEFRYRSKVKGGLTGYAQVYGKYNTSALDKLKMDLIYIMNYSLLLDLQIIFETVKILVQKESTEGFSEKEVENINEYVLNNKVSK